VNACPEGAISVHPLDKGFKIEIDRKKCNNCGKCIDVCTTGALKFYGQTMTIDEVFNEVKKDIGYYSKSQGGVTAGGGEALAQADFVTELFRRCRRIGVHTVLDTSGYSSLPALHKVLDEVDLVLFDVKVMNRQEHKRLTGRYNDVILRNARLIVAKGTPMIIRVPLIPGFNDSEDNLNEIARFVSELDNELHVDILPYHRFGENKYEMLDIEYQLTDVKPPDEEQIQKAKKIFERYGLDCGVQ
jgi:pyruvate formate lyase activating enzyme